MPKKYNPLRIFKFPLFLATVWICLFVSTTCVLAATLVEGTSGDASDELPLSTEQQQTVELNGWPHAFTLWRDDAGKRNEAWTWFDSGITYFFIDHEFTRWEPAAVLSLEAHPTPWRPTQFKLGISEAILRDVLKSRLWEALPLFELVEGVKGIAADGVVLSFDEQGLRVVETWSERREDHASRD